MYVKFTKCKFWLDEVFFLRYKISKDGISVDLSKVDTVTQWKQPKAPTEVRSFLGLTGYYRRFIKDFSRIAEPLTNLTKNMASLCEILSVKLVFSSLRGV